MKGDEISSPLNYHHSDLDGPTYKVYGYRWLILVLFCLLTIANAVLWISFAPIRQGAASYYDVSPDSIDMCSVIFMILYVPGTILCGAVLDIYGPYTGIISAGLLQAIAAALRYFSVGDDKHAAPNGYLLLMSGQALAALVQPVFTNSPARLSSIWFPADGRATATTLCAVANPLGIAIGQILPQFVQPDIKGNTPDQNSAASIAMLLFIQLAYAIGAFILAAVLFADKPPSPPSVSAAAHLDDAAAAASSGSGTIFHQLLEMKGLLGNKHFMLLTIGFSVGLALFNALGTLVRGRPERREGGMGCMRCTYAGIRVFVCLDVRSLPLYFLFIASLAPFFALCAPHPR